MKSKTILFRDPVVERVCDKFVKRSDVGYAKYGRTLHDERTGKHKDLAGYLNDFVQCFLLVFVVCIVEQSFF